MKIIQYIMFIVLFLLICHYSIYSSQESKNLGENYALLIGVNQYPNLPRKYQLRGCINDVELMEKLLIEIFQFRTNNIRKLTNKDATKNNIIHAFETFLHLNAEKDSQTVIYFSGHGGRMTDQTLDEPDGYDETILPYDAHRDKSRVCKDISDDEFCNLLNLFLGKCDNITVILDCCHSGSGIRGIDIPKQVDNIFEINSDKFNLNPRFKKMQIGFLPDNPKCILISGCKDDQNAYEMRNWKEWFKPYGSLTFALYETVRSNPNDTYRNIIHKVTEKVFSRNPNQHPQLEGKRRDAPFLGNIGTVQNFIEVKKRRSKKVILNGGRIHNVTKGSVYQIYTPGTVNTFNKKKYIGRCTISKINDFTSVCVIEEEKGRIEVNSSCFEILHNYGELKLSIKIDTETKSYGRKHIEQLIKNEPLLKIVSASEVYDLIISTKNNKLLLQKPGRSILSETFMDERNIEDKLIENLKKYARYQNFQRINNFENVLKIDLKMKRYKKLNANYTPYNEKQVLETKGGHRLLKINDYITLTVKNISLSKKSFYFYIFSLGTDGSVDIIYPPEGDQNNLLSYNLLITTYPMWISPPEGLNIIKVIATSIPIDMRILIQDGYKSGKQIVNNPMAQLINSAYNGRKSSEMYKFATTDWATEQLSFFIEK